MPNVENILRQMAWERAKGELTSMLVTYSPDDRNEFNEMNAAIHKFVEKVEDNGLHE